MNNVPKTSLRKLYSYLLVLILFVLPILACTEPDRSVDPTALAPADLSGQDFSHQDFAQLDLSGKNFQETKFINSQFYDVSFADADLRRANFTDAHGDDIDFTGADLRGAIFDNFCTFDAQIIWTEAQLDERWAMITELFENGFYPGQDLRGYDLSQVCLRYYDLSGVNLPGAKLTDANLTFTNFSAANLKGVDFSGAKLGAANFTQADLTGATGMQLLDFPNSKNPTIIVTLCDTRLPNGEMSDDRIERCWNNPSSP